METLSWVHKNFMQSDDALIQIYIIIISPSSFLFLSVKSLFKLQEKQKQNSKGI